MSDKLKIYACSGIGATTSDVPVSYWTDETNTISNTQAVNTLLAMINSRSITVQRLRSLSQEDKIALLNEIDLLCVALGAAKRFADNSEALRHAGEVIDEMRRNGAFKFDSLNSKEREDHLEELLAKANEAYEDGLPIEDISATFMQWWQETVEKRNIVGLNFGQQQNLRRAMKKAVSGIGASEDWMQNADLAEYLTKGSEYFLYTYFTDDQLAKLPGIFKLKRQKQLRTYNYCKGLFVETYGSEAEMQDIIRAGIIDYFQDEPETVCEQIASGEKKTKGVGELVLFGLTGAAAVKALLELLSILATLVIGIVTAICQMVKDTNVAKYGALDKQVVESSCPNPEDYEDINFGSSLATSNWLPLAAIGAALLLIFKK